MSGLKTNISKIALSAWGLGTLFLLALLLFVLFRFDAESLVRRHLNDLARQTGVEIDYDQVGMNGLGVQFDHLSLSSSRLPEVLIFESVKVLPEWRSLVMGRINANVSLLWQGTTASMRLQRTDVAFFIQEIQMQGEVAHFSRLLKPYIHLSLPVTVSGQLMAEGQLQFNQLSGVLEQGDIKGHWQGAKGGLLGAEFALGDILMEVQGKSGQWQWQLDDGEAGAITAHGSIQQSQASAGLWPIDGSAEVEVANIRDPYLLSWLQHSDVDQQLQLHLNISGTLSRPKLDRIK